MQGKHVVKAFFYKRILSWYQTSQKHKCHVHMFSLFWQQTETEQEKIYTRVLIDPARVLTFMFNALSDTPVNNYGESTEAMLSSRFISAVQLGLFHVFH